MPKDAFENFKKSWEGEIAKIENRPIDSRGVYRIYLHFQDQRVMLEMDMDEEKRTKTCLDLDGLESKLIIALETARSRYKLENRGLWARIIEGIVEILYKIPKSYSRAKRTKLD